MLVVMDINSTEEQINNVIKTVENIGYKAHCLPGSTRTAIGITGNKDYINAKKIELLPGVSQVIHVTKPYKLVSREVKKENSIIKLDNLSIGDKNIIVMAGPCAVESEEQCLRIAESIKKSGATVFRGGAFKPRTSPYAFQGLGIEGLKILKSVRDKTGLLIVTEAMDESNFDAVEEYTDIIQIGARNMQNFALLKRAGKSKRPILLKRGSAATIEELLMSAEYIMSEGNYNVILCERGIRTFSLHTRNTLDISSIPAVKKFSHLPIIVDPSHAAGNRDTVVPLAYAGIAAGADGIIIETHYNPDEALSDGPQTLFLEQFDNLMIKLKELALVLARNID